jgi:4-hydroxy-tetrahydrodipicolinate reductase
VELLRTSDFELIGAVDPRMEGTKVGGVPVGSTLSVLYEIQADVAFVTTSSSIRAAAKELEAAVRSGCDVLTTCEEMAFPWVAEPAIADHLDRVAKASQVRLLGCGVNPGFLMDALPVMLSGACVDVTSIRVARSVDLARRRPQLAEKLGTGLDEGSWRRRARDVEFGHRGLVESAWLCAIGAGWTVRSHVFDRSPVLRDGTVVGVSEVVDLRAAEDRSVRLELRFEVGGTDGDSIAIDGRPPLRVVFEGGVQGDDATVARLMNCARSVHTLPSGLRLPIEIPAWAQRRSQGMAAEPTSEQ